MDPEVRYTGTLQLKQLTAHRLTECPANPDQAAAWLAAVAYFENQLHRFRPQVNQPLSDHLTKTGD